MKKAAFIIRFAKSRFRESRFRRNCFRNGFRPFPSVKIFPRFHGPAELARMFASSCAVDRCTRQTAALFPATALMTVRPHTPSLSLFIVDDDVGFVHAAAELARDRGFDITVAGTVEQARARLAQASFDIALIDLSLPDGSGLDLLEHIDLGGRTQVILITGHPTVESALKALHLPIVDYVVKPLHASRFTELLDTAANRRRLPVPELGMQWHGLAGVSSAMEDVRRQIMRVAPTDAAVFIEGESGVGKELVAAAIHAESGRSGGTTIGNSPRR